MRIATYNVNGINCRLPVLLRWLELAEPDIVCLQELKGPDEKFPEKAVRDLGYDAIWHGQRAWNGVAILSRAGEIHETRRGLPGGLVEGLAEEGIYVAPRLARMRVSPHVFNDEDDVDRFVTALKKRL